MIELTESTEWAELTELNERAELTGAVGASRPAVAAGAPAGPPAVACLDLCKNFGEVRAVRLVSFTLDPGQFLALLGPSGCGKTTVLRLIAGLERPDGGSVAVNGRIAAEGPVFVPAHQRQIGMVFQDYALFPHMTIAQNVAYGLARGSNRAARVDEMLELVDLGGLGRRYPHELSGGQQQRAALARALAPQPDILLLDEPFSNLDVALRTQVREEVRRILLAAGVSAILVTHDQDEAMSFAHRVALMFEGTLVQCGTPRELYEQPVSRRAAQFLGEANVLPGQAHADAVLTALGPIPWPGARLPGEVDVLLRPEHLSLHLPAGSAARARVTRCLYYGTHQDVWIALRDSTLLKVRCPAHIPWQADDEVAVRIDGRALVFPATE